MVEAVLVFQFLHFTRGRPQLVYASVLPRLWSDVRLLARLGQPKENVVVDVALDVLPVLDEI